MISDHEGKTKLAFFDGQPQGAVPPIGIRRIAFRVNGEDFLKFVPELDALNETAPIPHSDIIDHERSFSVYFADPYGNPLEVTTYDYEVVRTRLDGNKGQVN